MRKTLTMIAAVSMLASVSTTALAADKPASIKAVGTWGSLTNYKKHEGPFWNDTINTASGGTIIGEIKPQTELGLKGFEIMRLIKNGVFDFAFGLPGYVAAENAIFEGGDLSAVTQDIATQRKVAEAYYPTLEKAFEETYNAKLMMLYPFPSQTLWCNGEVKGIADLNGKKIRVYSTTLGDFVEGVGGDVCNRTICRGYSSTRKRRCGLWHYWHNVSICCKMASSCNTCIYTTCWLGIGLWCHEHGQMELTDARTESCTRKRNFSA
jgi:TRAP-type C4-dicarboxylate transport system substrate-binding protein